MKFIIIILSIRRTKTQRMNVSHLPSDFGFVLLLRFESWSSVSVEELNVVAISSYKNDNEMNSVLKLEWERWIRTIEFITLVVISLIRSLLVSSTDRNFAFRKFGVRSIRLFTLPSLCFLCVGWLCFCKSTIFGYLATCR